MWGKDVFAVLFSLIPLMHKVAKDQQQQTSNTDQSKQKQQPLWSIRMADSVMMRSPDLTLYNDAPKRKWKYDFAMLGMAIDKLDTNNYNIDDADEDKYSRYMKDFIDYYVQDDGTILKYDIEDYNLDYVNPAKNLITLYKRTGNKRYKMAIDLIVSQLNEQPRTDSGGFFHKLRYPYQMWLDGTYMSSPFMAQYAAVFDEPRWYDEAVFQTTHIFDNTLDEESGLLFHAWQETRKEEWSDPVTGCSPNFWGRGMGWYLMGVVDTLDYLPKDQVGREQLLTILDETASALMEVRGKKTHLWYQVLDMGDEEGNYLEGSASAMYTYAFAKASKKGYLDPIYYDYATESFDAMLEHFISVDEKGMVTMEDIVGGTGLGGDPYRDGSYEYYITQQTIDNDAKGVAPFILAAIELDR